MVTYRVGFWTPFFKKEGKDHARGHDKDKSGKCEKKKENIVEAWSQEGMERKATSHGVSWQSNEARSSIQ